MLVAAWVSTMPPAMTAVQRENLYRKIFLAGGELEITIEELLATFDRKKLTEKARDEMLEQLTFRRQIHVSPALTEVQPGDRVRLRGRGAPRVDTDSSSA
ncbi:hypothetical protein DVA67_011890 [Solirubrobacter sp. CPCC 204708]|uniref:Uncharacterized protein n=1 Tax=Solirubrobacter deserti TaxID=2282478 RepID=A0ABT4RLP5_9ACTN|nr:hypothetical protein [Solirubrobacter deserti]MBE2316678.1 hypothetical protein [Solirubrobacter deserti]MDA0139434.1 hypothetical protein [Solirubrobacter deserti]